MRLTAWRDPGSAVGEEAYKVAGTLRVPCTPLAARVCIHCDGTRSVPATFGPLTGDHGRPELGWQPVGAFGPACMAVLKIVTVFTVAHSITLWLAVMEYVTLPSQLVESAIALSIVITALNNLYPVLPLSGWAMWSALGGGSPLDLLGVPWPKLPFHDVPIAVQWAILDWAEGIHALLVFLLLVMVPLHVGAALKHHFWNKHDVLIGMLPELEADEPADREPRHGLPGDESPPAPVRG